MDLNDIIMLSMLLDGESNKGVCSSCHKEFDVMTEFVEEKEFREYQLSRLCKTCQDQLFKRRE